MRPNFSDGVPQVTGLWRRFYRSDWNLSTAKSELIIPEKGKVIRGISLGSADQSGGFQLATPDYPNADIDGAPLLVGPRGAYFIGELYQPFTLYPTIRLSPSVATAVSQHVLDVCLWYELPYGMPLPHRGPRIVAGTLSGIASAQIPSLGRGDVDVSIWNATGGGSTTSVMVAGSFLYGTGIVDHLLYENATLADAAVVNVGLDKSRALTGSNVVNMMTAPHMIQVANLTASRTLYYRVELRD